MINIKIDVNEKVKSLDKNSSVTTYSYTGSGLAVKYTNAIENNSAYLMQNYPIQ